MVLPPDSGSSRFPWLARLDEVRESGDRRATLPLLAALLHGTLGGADVGDIVATLCALDDPRLVAPLEAILLDPEAPQTLRKTALEVVGSAPRSRPPRGRVEAWFRDADPLVRAYGVSHLDATDGERIARAVRDPAPQVRRYAAEGLLGLSRTPVLLEALAHALRDTDVAVRIAACRAAYFDEPLSVTFDLLRLLGDAEPVVRCAIYDTLEDYPCVAVLLALADARRGGPEGELVDASLSAVAARVHAALDGAEPHVRRRLDRWIAPAAWLLHETGNGLAASEAPDEDPGCDDRDDALPEPAEAGRPIDVAAVAGALLDPEAPSSVQRALLIRGHWADTGPAGVELLRRCAASPVWGMRHAVTYALTDMKAADDLLALASDEEPVVRRAALEGLFALRDPRAVEPALETLADPHARRPAGDAALQVMALLAPRAQARAAVIAELERDEDRDGLRLGAAELSRVLGFYSARPQLLGLVHEPVVAGAGTHVSALRALRALDVPRQAADLGHLEGIDHLDLQRELGEWEWHGPRYG